MPYMRAHVCLLVAILGVSASTCLSFPPWHPDYAEVHVSGNGGVKTGSKEGHATSGQASLAISFGKPDWIGGRSVSGGNSEVVKEGHASEYGHSVSETTDTYGIFDTKAMSGQESQADISWKYGNGDSMAYGSFDGFAKENYGDYGFLGSMGGQRSAAQSKLVSGEKYDYVVADADSRAYERAAASTNFPSLVATGAMVGSVLDNAADTARGIVFDLEDLKQGRRSLQSLPPWGGVTRVANGGSGGAGAAALHGKGEGNSVTTSTAWYNPELRYHGSVSNTGTFSDAVHDGAGSAGADSGAETLNEWDWTETDAASGGDSSFVQTYEGGIGDGHGRFGANARGKFAVVQGGEVSASVAEGKAGFGASLSKSIASTSPFIDNLALGQMMINSIQEPVFVDMLFDTETPLGPIYVENRFGP